MKPILDKAYFDAGYDWHYDRFESQTLQANRWFVAFIVSTLLCICLTIALTVLLPLKQWLPFVIHQNTTTGEVWVDRPNTTYTPTNEAEVKADIVRYLVARESYSGADINQRFHTVMLLSSNAVANSYDEAVSNNNKEAPVNTLGAEGYRTVTVNDIIFIDKDTMEELRHFHKAATNLAKVDFTVTTFDPNTNKKILTPWVATMGWQYRGTPSDESIAWENWNGFIVTTYRVDPVNISDNTSSF